MFIVTLWVMSFLKHRMVSYVIFFLSEIQLTTE
jgi:hypothetical protein